MKLKKILGITGLAVASTVALAACGAGGNKSAKDDKTLTVGIMTLDDTTEPLWDKVKELAKDKGVTIELKEFTDYNQPNEALKNGEIDVNAFQHIYFLNNWNKENKVMLLLQLTHFLAQSTFSQVLKTEKLSIKMLKSFRRSYNLST
ncbi:MAG: MetQ/NlpA family ABC transporter substrate-binding protein [Streptococcus sp.]